MITNPNVKLIAVEHSIEPAAGDAAKADGGDSEECVVLLGEAEAERRKREAGSERHREDDGGAGVGLDGVLPHDGADLQRGVG